MPVGSFPYVSEILPTRVQMTKDFWLNWFLMYLLLSNNMSVCGDNCRMIVFVEAMADATLQHHMIQTVVPSASEHSCSILCYLHDDCVSYNYGQEICQLNNSTAAEHPLDLKQKPNFIYRGIKNSCASMPCLNHGTCQSGFRPEGYRCICTAGSTGPQCDSDINECARNGSIPCENGGTCRNVIGGYECHCPQGFIGTKCETAAPECRNYISMRTLDRNVRFRGRAKCDNNLKEDWYRFQGQAGKQMATSCPPTHRCNTDLTGWMVGKHPNVQEGIVQREACFHGYYNCCHKKNTIDVRNCGAYFVYRLKKTHCKARYCGSD
ncbi:uromodulin-like isoform X2 [Montipora foliosa]|uniref:uromodulin-like isoform X2 n=1 Tax=Montipora foliosa TaxID=591990 RepID=UPI0035F15F68